MQNELLQCMSLQVQQQILQKVHNSPFFSIMVDECTDVSNKEQVAIHITLSYLLMLLIDLS